MAGISEAADQLDASDPATVARLADAASAQASFPLQVGGGSMTAVLPDGSTTTVSATGIATMSRLIGPEIGISPAGAPSATELTDGALVQSDVAPSTDVVTRATSDGLQMVAVLNDQSASRTVHFDLDLPDGAHLTTQADGSVAIHVPITEEVASEAEVKRISDAVDAVLGNLADDQPVTDEQQSALDSIKPAKTAEITTTKRIATLAAPWAVDANGKSVDTHYVINGNAVSQVIDANSNTAFPVTADPSVLWWIGTSALCVAEIASLAVGAAKVVRAFAKADKIVKSAKAVIKAYRALGGTMSKVVSLLKKYAKRRSSLTSAQIKALETFIRAVGRSVFNVLGLGSCYSLATTR
ncbi:hypothetical protein LK09_03775 [Microbacterium mangrovi]|uniref:Uncharacterized protein n=1 Tax=Microbacterium mangrovi TaxID=1348253 RepID=A0A0B2A7R0_9MICO|nr:hypothetical protein [Microbacterium mangrovi]KHK99140.1 hypothetical protein LK09_03775 [Microbacterium mangrovi]